MAEFTNLTGDDNEAIDQLRPQAIDVDRWELVLSTAEYLERFQDTLATVQLISRAPVRKMHTTYHRGPGFDKWLLLAEANHQLWIDPKYKDDFFDELNQYQVAQPGKFPNQASLGNVHVPTSVFIHCLSEAGCNTLRLKAYGQKMPMIDRFLTTEPAEVDHRWASHNEWDIGTTFLSRHIWLFSSATGRRHGIRHFSMLVPGSNDFGTVNIKAVHEHRNFTIKVYPKMVHVIKSFNSRLQGGIPKTVSGVRNQVAAGLRMIHSLSGKDAMALGGFRIEVTVKAPSLAEATRIVRSTHFLDPLFWLGIGDGPHSATPLTAKLVTREGLLANANWVYEQARQAKMFTGRGADRPTRVQIQALTDVLNALGWHGGLRRPTKSLNPSAWWNLEPPAGPSHVFQTLSTWYQTNDEIKALFNLARTNTTNGRLGLPCKAHPTDPTHRYQSNERNPFRIRCSDKDCGNKLQRAAIIHWIADLVNRGVVDGGPLGLRDHL